MWKPVYNMKYPSCERRFTRRDLHIYGKGRGTMKNRVRELRTEAGMTQQQLADLVTETLASEENHGIQVYIGDETPVKTMKDCSVVTATYELGEGMKGTIGIIGPKRMDYEHVMKTLKTLQSELDAIYYKDPEE